MEEKYKNYIFGCHCQGDIWWEHYRPYSYKEWIEAGTPEFGGVDL